MQSTENSIQKKQRLKNSGSIFVLSACYWASPFLKGWSRMEQDPGDSASCDLECDQHSPIT